MAVGNLWTESWAVGKETTPGTPVAATRKVYVGEGSTLTKVQPPRPHRFKNGTRFNVLAITKGPTEAGGTVNMPVSPSESLEWLAITVQGGVTATTPMGATDARLYTFKPGNTDADAMTIERNDGAGSTNNYQRATGVRGNQLTIAGSATGDNTMTVELFGQDLATTFSALTGSLTDRVPGFLEGWQTNWYATTLGGTPGAGGVLSGSLIEWSVQLGNALGRQYTAQNTQAANSVVLGEGDVTGSFKLAAQSATTRTKLAEWEADTAQLLRLEFLGPVDGIESGFREFMTIDLPGKFTSPDLNQADAGNRAYTLPFQFQYDPTNAFALQIRCQCERTAIWA